MKSKKSAAAATLLIISVVLSFAAGFYLGQTGGQENARDEEGVNPVLGRDLHADVITEKAEGAVAMNSTNGRLRNQTLLQKVMDEAVRNPNRSEEDGERYDARIVISKEEDENISRVLNGVPYYKKDERPLRGHYIRHRGEILAVGITVRANQTAP